MSNPEHIEHIAHSYNVAPRHPLVFYVILSRGRETKGYDSMWLKNAADRMKLTTQGLLLERISFPNVVRLVPRMSHSDMTLVNYVRSDREARQNSFARLCDYVPMWLKTRAAL